ncbi:MAG: HesA/MoeB/ThiF family protein [Candidatus Melainabacteria bacterium]|nr:HesA/MoeB/ThiF family protein [Candidatus Melainabacteria bacterium]
MELTNEELKRYSRQIVLPEISIQGQLALQKSKVLVAGAGGLGSSALLYLASSGIGTIGVIDYDNVDLSNLHRQVIHYTDDLNKSKVISAKEKINKLNPNVKVVTFNEKLSQTNIKNILNDFEIVIDGLDNFNDKFLLNDSCVLLNKKLIHAGVIGFEGQILTIIPKKSACLRCFFPDKIPDNLRQSCKEIGVLSTCVGVLSIIQANEAIKLILGIGKPLTNKVLKFNALDGTFYEFKVQDINKSCPVCNLAT